MDETEKINQLIVRTAILQTLLVQLIKDAGLSDSYKILITSLIRGLEARPFETMTPLGEFELLELLDTARATEHTHNVLTDLLTQLRSP